MEVVQGGKDKQQRYITDKVVITYTSDKEEETFISPLGSEVTPFGVFTIWPNQTDIRYRSMKDILSIDVDGHFEEVGLGVADEVTDVVKH